MRVAIDATPLTLSSGGLRRYTCELSLALAREYPQDEYFLVSDQPFEVPPAAPRNLKRGGGPRNAWERRWWLYGLNRELDRLGVDLFHGTDFSVPYVAGRPAILTLHDLSPWMNSAWHSQASRVKRRTPFLLRFGLAAMVITPSDAVRRQTMETFRVRSDRIRAIPHAASDSFRPSVCEAKKQYFLYAGTLEPRKNIPTLLAAWRTVYRATQTELFLAGRQRYDFPQLSPEPGLQLIGEVTDLRLAELMSCALAVVYPSSYEGFGLPVLEAMQCGACVITSQDPAITEIASGAAIQAGSQTELEEAMLKIATHPEQAATWRSRAIARAADYSWVRTARLTHQLYMDAIEALPA